VIGIDWRISIKETRDLGITKPLQGNLDPAILLSDWKTIEERTKAIIDQGRDLPAHIFNLGHGVTPEIDPAILKKVTDLVHQYSKQ